MTSVDSSQLAADGRYKGVSFETGGTLGAFGTGVGGISGVAYDEGVLSGHANRDFGLVSVNGGVGYNTATAAQPTRAQIEQIKDADLSGPSAPATLTRTQIKQIKDAALSSPVGATYAGAGYPDPILRAALAQRLAVDVAPALPGPPTPPHPHFEWPQFGQVRQPSDFTIPNCPQEGQAGPRGAAPTGIATALGSTFSPIPSPFRKPIATMCRSITPPMAARIEGM